MTAPNNVTPPTPPAQVPVDEGKPRRHDNKQGKKPLYKRWWFWLIRSTGCPWGCRFHPVRQRHGDVSFDRKQHQSDHNTGEIGEI